MKESAELRVHQETLEVRLLMGGWFCSDEGWRHRAFWHPWPLADAVKLEEEVENGSQDLACRLLREWRQKN